jgi:sensor histidine kinase YesM
MRWGIPFLIWSVPAALWAVGSALEGDRTLGRALLRDGLPWYYWVFVTQLVLRLARRNPLESLRTRRGLLKHASSALLAALVYAVLTCLLYYLFPSQETTQRTPTTALVVYGLFWTFFGLLFYTTTLSVGFALDYQQRLRERELATSRLEARLVEAQLGALRMQLQPHFLFNSLNTIAMHVRDGDRNTSIRLLTRLSELLRHLLDGGSVQEVPLHNELEQVRRYLEIEGARFSDRLRFQLTVPPELTDAFVPNLLLQPLVENAIRHGLAARATAGLIELTAHQSNGRVLLALSNEGPPLPAGWNLDQSSGIGLRNTALRLQHLYGAAAELRVSDWQRGVRIEISIPHHTRPIEQASHG